MSQVAGTHALELETTGGVGASYGLTIEDAQLSDEMEDPEWWKESIRKLMIRLRNRGYPTRYWTVAERGEMFGRPHAHVAIPGIAITREMRSKQSWWKYGEVHQQQYDIGTAYYLADYMAKPEKKHLKLYSGHSQKYGHLHADRMIAEWCQKGTFPEGPSFELKGEYGKRRFAMARWFVEKCYDHGLLTRLDPRDAVGDWVSEDSQLLTSLKGVDPDYRPEGWKTRVANRDHEAKIAQRRREAGFEKERKDRAMMNGAVYRLTGNYLK